MAEYVATENRAEFYDLYKQYDHGFISSDVFRRSQLKLTGFSDQQLEVNFRGVSVALYDHKDQLLGALSVTMPINNESQETALKRVLPVLQETARSMRLLL